MNNNDNSQECIWKIEPKLIKTETPEKLILQLYIIESTEPDLTIWSESLLKLLIKIEIDIQSGLKYSL